MYKRWTIFTALAAALMMATMFACGGGGSSESVNYEGETMAAVIDTTASVDLAKDVFGLIENDPMNDDDVPSPLSMVNGTYSGMAADPARAVALAASYMNRPDPVGPLSARAEPLATICDSDVIGTGSVGGDLVLEVCGDPNEIMNNDQYHISIAFIFRDFDDGDEQIDGEIEVYGLFDDFENDFVDDIKITFRDLTTYAPPTEDSFIDGWVEYDEAAGVQTMVYNLFLVNNLIIPADGVWMDNYTIVLNDNLDTVTFDGRLYDMWDGYLDVTTETPLAIAMHYEGDELVFDDEYPTAGALRLTGASGAWILVEFRDNGGTPELRVTVDLDNDPMDDPLWEWQSSWQEWVPSS